MSHLVSIKETAKLWLINPKRAGLFGPGKAWGSPPPPPPRKIRSRQRRKPIDNK